MSSDRVLRWLCWSLVVLVLISAAVTVLFVAGYLRPAHDAGDFVETLLLNRQSDVEAFPFVIIGSLGTLGVYLVSALLGVHLRRWIAPSSGRDMLTVVLVLAGAVGIVTELMNIGVGAAAGPYYCDCAYKNEDVISLNSALTVGWFMVNWLGIGGITLIGAGVALAGRLIDVSSTWRSLSYAIAGLIVLAVIIRLVGSIVFISAFDPFQISDIIVALVSAILVPIWAILLARGVRPAMESAPA